MAPEKTHSQNPGYSPSREKGAVQPAEPTPPDGVWLLFFSTEMVFMCHLFFFFSIESFLSFCSPSCLIESLSLYLQLPCSQSSLFPRGDTESDFSLQLQLLSVMGGPESLCYFFSATFPGKRGPLLHFACFEIPKTVSKLILFSSFSFLLFKNNQKGMKREEKRQ